MAKYISTQCLLQCWPTLHCVCRCPKSGQDSTCGRGRSVRQSSEPRFPLSGVSSYTYRPVMQPAATSPKCASDDAINYCEVETITTSIDPLAGPHYRLPADTFRRSHLNCVVHIALASTAPDASQEAVGPLVSEVAGWGPVLLVCTLQSVPL